MNSTATFYPAPGDMPFSSAVRAGGFLMLSGQIPFGEDKRPLTGPIEEQTHAVLKAIAARLDLRPRISTVMASATSKN